MAGLDWLRFNTLSVGSLTTSLLLALISVYLLSLRNKKADTWYLAGYIGVLLILLLSYTIRYCLFDAVASHSAQVSNLIVFGIACLIQFAYLYGGNQHPRESRLVLVLSLASALLVWGSLFFMRNVPWVYDFQAQYFSLVYAPRTSFYVLVGYLWTIVVLLRKTVRASRTEENKAAGSLRFILKPVGRMAHSARSFALLTLATTVIALFYMFFQTGIVSRNTYTLVFNNGSLIICLLIFIVYVNNSPQPTSYVAKLIGIPLAVIMVAFGITASILMPVVHSGLADHYSREIDQVRLAVRARDFSGLSSGVAYIIETTEVRPKLRYSTAALEDWQVYDLALLHGFEGLIPRRKGLSPRFLYLDLFDTDSFYLFYEIEYRRRSYRIGIPYRDYRLWIHRFSSKLALVAVISFVLVVLGFPFVFRRGLLKPLVTLHKAVQQVSSGNYRMYVPVPSEDEVGQLARGYNQMVSYLRSAEGNFKALAENSADAILIFSARGRILYANKRSSEISGYNAQNLRSMHFRDLVHEQELALINRRFASRISGQDVPRCYETRIIAADRRVIPVEITGARTTWQNSTADVVIIRDISERREAEQKLQLQQQQLMRADKLASLGALVAGVAHEVNNPNQAIGMNARFLLEGLPRLFVLADSGEADASIRLAGMSYPEFKTAAETALSEIGASTARIEHIVSELKRFVRGGAGGQRAPTEINEVVRTVADLSRHLIARTTDRFRLDLQSDLPPISADRIGLEQVILNLLHNACQALSDRTQQIRIATELDREAGSLTVTVADQGRGIAEADLSRLTDAFFTTRSREGGSGLGLSISRRIIRDHGGTLEFRSSPGHGTTVTVHLPLDPTGSKPG